jgi:hypothetical protein
LAQWLSGVNVRPNSAFTSSVEDHTFSFGGELRPMLRELGMEDFRVRYLNFSPMFFSIRFPRPVWHFWCACDRVLAGRATRWSCSAGVLSARKVS